MRATLTCLSQAHLGVSDLNSQDFSGDINFRIILTTSRLKLMISPLEGNRARPCSLQDPAGWQTESWTKYLEGPEVIKPYEKRTKLTDL